MLLATLLLAAAQPPAAPLAEAAHAISAGRLEQARLMIGHAVEAGASGAAVERLVIDLAYASGNWAAALAGYETLLVSSGDDAVPLERAGIAALHLGQRTKASALLARATARPDAGWRAWNALGALKDGDGNWDAAGTAYDRAERLSPGQPEVRNNRGWSLILQRRWSEAVPVLEQAAFRAPSNRRVADNLELARAAVAQDLPRRLKDEADEAFAARLNDAGVVAIRAGDGQRAVAAFARALEARSTWYERAANNLAMVEQRR